MPKNLKVERLAKQKMGKAIKATDWDDLRDQSGMKQYYRDQARQELNLPRNPEWEKTHPR